MARTRRSDGWSEQEVLNLVRGRIIAGIHGGHLDTGDRLPSYREVAEETRADLRLVARVYRRLEEEGLVQVRGRAGVFVAEQERIGGRVLAETARWMVTVLRDAWNRRIAVPELPDFVRRCTESRTVRCACIESTRDQMDAMCIELHQDFGFKTSPLHADRLAPLQVGSIVLERIPREIREADLLVTTTYHAGAVRHLAEVLEKPLAVIRLSAASIREMERRLEEGEITVICVDPGFVERVREVVTVHPERIRGVLVDDREGLAHIDRSRPVLASRAARKLLKGMVPNLLPLAGPAICEESAEELAEALVRLNLEAGREKLQEEEGKGR
ncbi:MAG TPA: GntR family transcriptional regulator [Longimicrobiaceae bacterium]|nr:GntR family transcriptional regulator [Longimicrobiaceae bacterium]